MKAETVVSVNLSISGTLIPGSLIKYACKNTFNSIKSLELKMRDWSKLIQVDMHILHVIKHLLLWQRSRDSRRGSFCVL